MFRLPKTVLATPQEKAGALATLSVFVPSAFTRQHLERSWPLATAHMKIGTSRADWLAGNLPIVPYSAAGYRTFGTVLKYQYRHVLGYDVLMLPKETAAGKLAGQQVYSCELHDVHGTLARRLLLPAQDALERLDVELACSWWMAQTKHAFPHQASKKCCQPARSTGSPSRSTSTPSPASMRPITANSPGSATAASSS